MSSWTHVNGTITVDIHGSYSDPTKVEKYVEYALGELKRNGHEITGSEGPCETWVNAKPRAAGWSSDVGDCFSSAVITFCGALRDREGCETDLEIKGFIENLRRYCRIIFCHIDMYCDWESIGFVYTTAHHSSAKGSLQLNCVNTYIVMDYCDLKEEYTDKLDRICIKNLERFNNRVTDKDLVEIYDRLSHLDPHNFKKVMEMGSLYRQVDWGFTDDMVEWRKEHGLKMFKELQEGVE